MPKFTPIDFKQLDVGSAQTFRENLNYNFSLINNSFEQFDLGNGIIVSAVQPTGQEVGDFWYRII